MIAMTERRNRAHVAAERARFQTVALDLAEFGNARFEKVFAVHVGVFLRQPTRELAVIRRHLAPGGALYLIHQPLTEARVEEIADRQAAVLRAHGFAIRQVAFQAMLPVTASCVIATAT